MVAAATASFYRLAERVYLLQQKEISCPYCGEWITVQVDCSISRQRYVEDCQVCCRPIVIDVEIWGEDIQIQAQPENG